MEGLLGGFENNLEIREKSEKIEGQVYKMKRLGVKIELLRLKFGVKAKLYTGPLIFSVIT